MILCPICNQNCKNRRILSVHLSRTHKTIFKNDLHKEEVLTSILFGEHIVSLTIQDYINEKYCIYNLPIDINKLITLMGLKRTSKQERATERYKQTYIKGIQKKYGLDITNISQVKEIQEKKKQTAAKKYSSYEEYLKFQRNYMLDGYRTYIGNEKHRETQYKIQQTCLYKYGNNNFGAGQEAKQKRMKTMKEIIATWDYEERLSRTSAARNAVNHQGAFSSKPEKRIRKMLIDLNIESLYNKQMWNYSWDLVIDKIIIEVQGIMWHAKPGIYKEDDLIMGKILAKDIWKKDKRKKIKAESEGYKIIEIWEDEINSRNDIDLQLLMKERLKENGYEFYN